MGRYLPYAPHEIDLAYKRFNAQAPILTIGNAEEEIAFALRQIDAVLRSQP
jgi:hypothetical protein